MGNEILNTIQKIRDKNPYLRIGQIISIALPARFGFDCFSISDEELLKSLNEIFNELHESDE